MKTKSSSLWVALVFVALGTRLIAQSTAFTYQGRLDEGAVPANGTYDLAFSVWVAESGAYSVGISITNTAVAVSNGLFSVLLNFGATPFTGQDRWLEIGVRTNGGGEFSTLSPRQRLTSTPYAFRAQLATTTAPYAVDSVSLQNNVVTSDKVLDGSIGAADIDASQFDTTFWRASGNAGTTAGTHFLGTTDNQALELRAGNLRGLRLEPALGAPNVLGGAAVNYAGTSVRGATIAGGGGADPSAATRTNAVTGDFGTVGGGWGNSANYMATVGGGRENTANGWHSTVNGGLNNQASGSLAAIGGGFSNIADGEGAVVPGGEFNRATAKAFAAGYGARAIHTGTFVWADSQETFHSSTANNQFLIRASGGVGIGTNNPQSALHVVGTVKASAFEGNGAGLNNLNADRLAEGLIPDGRLAGSVARTNQVWLLGGNTGTAAGTHFVGTTDSQPLEFKVNGLRTLRLEYPTVGTVPNLMGGFGGNSVGAGTEGAVIAGGGSSGGYENTIGLNADYSAIGGGWNNTIANSSESATVAGGTGNDIDVNSSASVIAGGANNNIANSSQAATIAGGEGNDIGGSSYWSTIAGGIENNISGGARSGTIAGGAYNDIGFGSWFCAIGGGWDNNIAENAYYATIPGGNANFATNNAFAAGTRAKANHTGSFVWSDATAGDFSSTASNQFNIRATGGLRLDNATSQSFGNATRQMLNLYNADYAIGVQAYTLYFRADAGGGGFAWHKGGSHSDAQNDPGAGGATLMRLDNAGQLFTLGAINPPSDRHLKENFKPVDPQAVLAKVTALPLSEWNYKADAGTRHLGPMAQDFYAAFGVGPDDKHITTVDADGVALAAIQGLNLKLEQKLEQKETEITELKQQLAELKTFVEKLANERK